jgi:hypothetical protein
VRKGEKVCASLTANRTQTNISKKSCIFVKDKNHSYEKEIAIIIISFSTLYSTEYSGSGADIF